jgi:Rrf2 family protein
MFGLSKKIDYGLELMVFLAKNYSCGPVSLKKVAQEKKLPYKFLGQIAGELKAFGLIDSKEGKKGGYFLTQAPKKISVAEVVEVLEGPVEVGACLGCPKANFCGQKNIWPEIGESVRKMMKGKTLESLIK